MHRLNAHYCAFSQSSLLKANQIESMVFGCVVLIGLEFNCTTSSWQWLLPVVFLDPEEPLAWLKVSWEVTESN